MNVSHNLNSLAKMFGTETPLFIVGGAVRNSILRLPCSDIDICSSLKVKDVEKLLEGSNFSIKIKNKTLNTCEIVCGKEVYEYATFRKEFYDEGGAHKPSSIDFNATIVEDASRRDFTCNSLYYEIIENKLIDFFGGENDIKNKVIKTVVEPEAVLCNDGVRVLRLVRFASELNFVIDNDTFAMAEKYKDNLKDISKDRIREEFVKILNASSTYKRNDRKSIFNKNRGYNGIKLVDKLNLWCYFGVDARIESIRGVGAYLNAFLKCKDDSLSAFAVDCYFYLKNKNVVTSPKDFVDMIFGASALNMPKATKTSITNTLKELDIVDSLESMESDKACDIVKNNIAASKQTMQYVKALGGRRYVYLKKLLKKAK